MPAKLCLWIGIVLPCPRNITNDVMCVCVCVCVCLRLAFAADLFLCEGAISSSCLKMDYCWAGRRACVWLVVADPASSCDTSRREPHVLYLQSKPCCTRDLSLNACSTYGCLGTLYLMQLATPRLPAVTCIYSAQSILQTSKRPITYVICMSSALLLICARLARHWLFMQQKMVLINQKWIVGCWVAPEPISGWPRCPVWCSNCE